MGSIPARFVTSAAIVAGTLVASICYAEPYPTKPIRFIVANAPGASTSFVEGRITHAVTTRVAAKRMRLPAGAYVIPMAQANANVAVVALEPESPSSFVAFGLIPVDTRDAPATIGAGSEVPVYRVLRPTALTLSGVLTNTP